MQDFFDLPFFYVFDGKGLTDGKTYRGLSVPVESDSEFRLRAMHGFTTVGMMAGLRNGQNQPLYSGPPTYDPGTVLFPMEVIYPPGSSISFDIADVSRSYTEIPESYKIYLSKIVFAGVKRFYGSKAQQIRESHYPSSMKSYRTRYRALCFSFTVDWYYYREDLFPALVENPAREFRFRVDDYDFEAMAFSFARVDPGQDSYINNYMIEVMPYDVAGRKLANDMVPVECLNYVPGLSHMLFPMVPIFWPRNSEIRIAVKSTFHSGSGWGPSLGLKLQIFGAERIPC